MEKKEWKSLGSKSNKFIKFEVGKTIEGVYQGFSERPSPFVEGATISDYIIEQEGEVKTLSTTSENLKSLRTLKVGTAVKIEMTQKGIKKLYNIFVQE